MRHIITVLCFVLLTACSTFTGTNYYSQTVDSWRGGNVSTLTARWGTPDDQVVTASGNTLYIYKTVTYANNARTNAPSIGVNYSANGTPIMTTEAPDAKINLSQDTLPLACIVIFEVDGQGKVVSTKAQGNNCYGNRDFALKKGNPSAPVSFDAPQGQ